MGALSKEEQSRGLEEVEVRKGNLMLSVFYLLIFFFFFLAGIHSHTWMDTHTPQQICSCHERDSMGTTANSWAPSPTGSRCSSSSCEERGRLEPKSASPTPEKIHLDYTAACPTSSPLGLQLEHGKLDGEVRGWEARKLTLFIPVFLESRHRTPTAPTLLWGPECLAWPTAVVCLGQASVRYEP